jgi:putative transposase
VEAKRQLIDHEHTQLSVREQCALIGLCRASYYYTPEDEREMDLELMHLIDREYTEHPFYGSRRMVVMLREHGHLVNRKRVQRLMREMGIEALYPKRNLSLPGQREVRFPYLLRGVTVDCPNKVWCADITYIPIQGGFGYCVAVMDWWSRCVLSWRVSNSMEVDFCLEALEEAFSMGRPEIFNTDQGSQFTSSAFVGALLKAQVRISWDGRGRAMDNIFLERLWRSLKYEEVYLKEYKGLVEAREGIGRYFDFYNTDRPHQALRNQTPGLIYAGSLNWLGALPPDPRQNAQAAVSSTMGD